MASWHQKKYWLAVILLTAGILFQHLLYRPANTLSAQGTLQGVPYQVGGWQGVDQPLERHVLDVLGLDAYVQRRYLDDRGRVLWLYVGYYHHQRQGKGIHSPKHCYPGAGWSMVEKGTETVSIPGEDPNEITVNRIVFQREGARQVILYWFQSTHRIVHSEYAQRLYLVLDAIVHHRTDGALVKVSAPISGDPGEALAAQKEFIKLIFPDLRKSLSGT